MPAAYCRQLVQQSHFAVGPFLGLVVFRSRQKPEPFAQLRLRLSSGFAFLQSLTRLTLADAPPGGDGASSSHELLFPSALAGIEDPLGTGLPDPLRSAFRVWLPSWRFSPLDTWPALFRAGSAPGIFHTLRSFLLPKGTRGRYAARWTRVSLASRYTFGRTLRADRPASTSGL
jgi:hypothetical protein